MDDQNASGSASSGSGADGRSQSPAFEASVTPPQSHSEGVSSHARIPTADMGGDIDSLTPGGIVAQRLSGVMPFSYLMSAKSDIAYQTRSTTSQLDAWSRPDTMSSYGEPSDPSTTDFNYAAYIRERGAISQQYLSSEGEAQAPPEPHDPFNMDAAKQQLLKTPPTCFIVIGKPGSGKTTMARLLANWWRAIYISADTLVEDIVDSGSELGLRFWSLLTSGMSIPEQLTMAMLSERLQREDVRHYGYVLDGFPCLSEKVMSQLDQLKMVLESPLPPTVIIHLRISDEDLMARVSTYRVDEAKGRLYTWIYYTEKPKPPKKTKPSRLPPEDDEEDGEEEEEEEAEDEEMIEEEEEVEEEEVPEPEDENEELGEREEEHEPPPPKPPKKMKPMNPLLPAPKALWDKLLRVPEGQKSRFADRLEAYKSRMMLLLEDYMTNHSPEFLIEIDAALAPKAAFDSLQYRLAVLPIYRAMVPVRLQDQDGPPAVSGEDDPEQIAHVLSRTSPLCLRFKWTPSDFGVTCPVSLKDGRIVRGDPKFAVGFLDHFYLTAGEGPLSLFMQNPRRFLTEPPRLPCRVIVCGPAESGRTTLASQIASCYAAIIIDASQASGLYLVEKRNQYRDEKRAEKRRLLTESIAERKKKEEEEVERLKKQKEEKAKQEEEERKKLEDNRTKKEQKDAGKSDQTAETPATAEGEASAVSEAGEEQEQRPESRRSSGTNSSQSPDADSPVLDAASVAGKSSSTSTKTPDTEAGSRTTSQDQSLGTEAGNRGSPQSQTPGAEGGSRSSPQDQTPGAEAGSRSSPQDQTPGAERGSRTSSQDQSLMDSDGSEKQSEEPPDPEVEVALLEYAPELEALVLDVQLEPVDWLRLLQETVAETELQRRDATGGSDAPAHGGWVIDNMPTDPALWELMPQEQFEYDDLVCIWDDSDDFLFLQDYFYQEHREQVAQDAGAARTAEDEAAQNKYVEQTQQERERARQAEERQEQEAVSKQMEAIMGGGAEADGAPPPTTAPSEQKTDEEEAKPDDTPAQPATLSIGGQPAAASAPQEKPKPAAPPSVVSGVLTTEPQDTPEPREDGALSPLVPPEPPPDCPMLAAYRQKLMNFSQDWSAVRTLSEPRNCPEPIILALDKVVRSGTTLLKIVTDRMQHNFRQQARELTDADDLYHEFGEVDDEVEEDPSEAEEEDESEHYDADAEGDEVDEQVKSDLKKLYGETGKFCPVAYTRLGVMQPGQAEFAVGYRGQLYLTSSQEAMESLMAEPERYIPAETCPTPPPLRLILLGAYGSGKSGRGRRLAEDCGVFFVDYAERLQEVMLLLGRPRIGKHFRNEVAGEETIADDITDVVAETARMREEFEQRQADRREEQAAQAGGGETSSAGFTTPPPDTPAATEEPAPGTGGDESDSEDAETAARRQDQAGWTDWQVEVETHLLGEVGTLSPDTLDELVRPWWDKAPFKDAGFVMEGFPATRDDLQYLTERHLFPDAFVVLATDPEQTVERLLAGRMAEWQEKMDGFRAKLKETREAKVAERLREKEERRGELREEIERKKKQREERLLQQALEDDGGDEEGDVNEDEPPEGSDAITVGDELGEEEDTVDIEQIITDEFPEIEEGELSWETKEEAKERISDILRQWHEEDTAAIALLKEAAVEANIPWLEVDSKRRGHIVDFQLATAVEKFTKYRTSLMQRAYPIGTNLAALLLDVGYRQLSKFGKQCPVTLRQRGLMMPPFNPVQRRPYPVIFRRHVYYCVNSAAAAKFVGSPLLYTEQKPPLYLIPSRVAVLGPPKSGKTSVSCGLAQRYGLLRVTAGEAVRGLLERWPPLQLAERVRRHLADGQAVPEPLLVAAIQVALLSVPAQVHGFVLDGWPQNERQATALTAAGVLPYLVLELGADAATSVRRARRQENWLRAEHAHLEAASTRRRPPAEEPRLESPLAHCVRLASWRQESEQLGQHYLRLHGNLETVRADGSLWAVEKAARGALEQRLHSIYQYRECASGDRAAPIGALCITPDELVVRLGPLGHYCPVCWRDGLLTDLAADRRLTHAVEMRGRYYRACGADHQAALLADGADCVPPRAAPLPAELPRRLSQLDTAELLPNIPLAFGGFCTVSYVRGGRRYEALVRGDETVAVGYQHQVYLLASEEARAAFMAEPRRYYACVLPKKLPPVAAAVAAAPAEPEKLDVTSLPLPGYLEQTLGYHLVRVLTAAGCRRPKHPQLGVTASALVYVALLLQSRVATSDCVGRRRQQRLSEFEAGCGLVERLGRAVNSAGSDPRRLPDRLRDELDQFTALLQRPAQAVYRDVC